MHMKYTLKDIINKKKEKILLAKQAQPIEELKIKIPALPPARTFIASIRKPHVISLIAEVKKASPSRGILRQNFDLREITKAYEDAGAQALSILTEEDYFLGNISYINEIKNAVTLPILRKDFIFEPYQVYESRLYGADAILLIADLLSKEKLSELMRLSSEVGLEYLVEVHGEKELKKVLDLKAPLIGINNRDLRTLEVDFKTTEKLFTLIPKDRIIVIESGIKTHQDILFLKVLGAHAVLIGETFMAADDIRKKVKELMGW